MCTGEQGLNGSGRGQASWVCRVEGVVGEGGGGNLWVVDEPSWVSLPNSRWSGWAAEVELPSFRHMKISFDYFILQVSYAYILFFLSLNLNGATPPPPPPKSLEPLTI